MRSSVPTLMQALDSGTSCCHPMRRVRWPSDSTLSGAAWRLSAHVRRFRADDTVEYIFCTCRGRAWPVALRMHARGYGQFCPVAKACEIFAERWTPLILRELMCGSSRFGELHQGLRKMSRTLLSARLRELQDAGIVHSEERANGHGREYRLTAVGEELRPMIMLLGEWGQRWLQARVDSADLDVFLLMTDMQRNLRVANLPLQRTVVRFDFRGVPRNMAQGRTWWLVLGSGAVDLCHKNPGFEVDLVVDADLRAFAEVWLGRQPLASAIRSESVTLRGPRALVRAFPSWFALSVFAATKPESSLAHGLRAVTNQA